MRKPRDFDAELQALEDKTKRLKGKKVRQLGELVIATGADATDMELLAGALLDLTNTKDQARAATWRKRGAEFFQGRAGDAQNQPSSDAQRTSQSDSGEAAAGARSVTP